MALSVTNRELREIHQALTALAGRTLPTIKSDLKVAKLLRSHVAGPYRDSEATREGIVRRHPTPVDTEEAKTPPAIQEARANEFNDHLDATVDLGDVPDALLIVEDDLPKALKGETGEANRQGVAGIVALLGPFYKESA